MKHPSSLYTQGPENLYLLFFELLFILMFDLCFGLLIYFKFLGAIFVSPLVLTTGVYIACLDSRIPLLHKKLRDVLKG